MSPTDGKFLTHRRGEKGGSLDTKDAYVSLFLKLKDHRETLCFSG